MASSSRPAALISFLSAASSSIGPELVRVAGQAPAGVVADRLVARLVAARRAEVIDQVHDQVRAAALPGELVVLRVELVAIESESEFHGKCRERLTRGGMAPLATHCKSSAVPLIVAPLKEYHDLWGNAAACLTPKLATSHAYSALFFHRYSIRFACVSEWISRAIGSLVSELCA